MLNIVVLLSGNGSTLQSIIDAIARDHLSIKILAVVSDRKNALGLTRAKHANIPAHHIPKLKGQTQLHYESQLLACILDYQPALIVLAGFMRILSKNFIDHYPDKIMNIHPSLLPKYPGLHTHERVLENHDREHGTTIHLVTPEVDAGPILCQAKLCVSTDDTITTLKKRVQQLEHQLYPLVLRWWSEGQGMISL